MDPDELDWLAEFVSGLRYRVRAGIATHAHHDHVLWHPVFGDAPRRTSARTVELVDEHRGELLAALGPDDLPAYLAGLDTLAPYVAKARMLVPGHGRPTSAPLERLDADRRYLDALLEGRDPEDPWRSNEGMTEIHEQVTALARAHRG